MMTERELNEADMRMVGIYKMMQATNTLMEKSVRQLSMQEWEANLTLSQHRLTEAKGWIKDVLWNFAGCKRSQGRRLVNRENRERFNAYVNRVSLKVNENSHCETFTQNELQLLNFCLGWAIGKGVNDEISDKTQWDNLAKEVMRKMKAFSLSQESEFTMMETKKD